MGLKNDQSAFMTTAEALAVVREALAYAPFNESEHIRHPAYSALASIEERLEELEAFRLRGNARRLAEAEAERDNATAALERMRLELLRVDKMVSRYSQSADAVSEDRARWMERCAELEAEREAFGFEKYIEATERVIELGAALRELLAQGIDDVDSRLDYVYIQADREAVEAARRALQPEEDA